MNDANLVMLLVIIVLLFALIFLAIAEMGLSKMTKPRAAAITEDKPRIEPSLTALVDNPEGWINPLLLMVNVCQTVQATLTGIVAGNLFGGVGVAVGVTLNVIVFFVLAEAVPKTYAVLNPDRAAMIAARPVRALTAFPPLRMISAGLIGLTNVLVKGRGLESGPFVSEQEFLGIVEAAAQDEVIEHEERELIESIIEFGDTVAREVMVPRPDMVMVANTATITDALNLGIAHGFSRLPVSGSDEDDIVGLAFTKDLMRAEREGRGDLPVLDLARDVTFIPENKPVARLMREMQDSKFHIAIVADEYGDIAGLVTLEDCLEELVGEIVDEYDAAIRRGDRYIGIVVEELRRRGLLDRTVIVFTSDHGEEFLEHGRCFHLTTLYREVLHVPLIISGPGLTRGREGRLVPASVSIAPTLLAVAGVEDHRLPGQSLLANDVRPAAFVVSETERRARNGRGQGHLRSLTTDSEKLLHRVTDGNYERFDLTTDPAELEPVTAGGRLEILITRLERWLSQHPSRVRRDRSTDTDDPRNSELDRQLRRLGYRD